MAVESFPIDIGSEDKSYSIDDGSDPKPVVDQSTAQTRAQKAAIGVGELTNKTEDDYLDMISQGQEFPARQEAASAVDKQRLFQAKDMISQGRVASQEDAFNLLKDATTPTDPNTVFERQFADKYIKGLNWGEGKRDSWLDDARLSNPMLLDKTQELGVGLRYKMERMKSLLEDLEGKASDERFIDKLGYFTVDLMTAGLYGSITPRTFTDASFLAGGLGGSNVRAQATRLFELPQAEFDKELDRLRTYENPIMVRDFVKEMYEGSYASEAFSNLFDAVNYATLLSPLKGAFKPATSIAKDVAATSKNAVGGMLRPWPKDIPTPVAAPAMAGNLPESSVTKVAIDTINEFKGNNNPVQTVKDRLTSSYNMDAETASSNPGRMGTEGANRIADVIGAQRDTFIDKAFTESRVNRTPATVTIKEETDKVRQVLSQRHRGIDNQVLDVSKPMYVEGVNVYAHNIAIGTGDAELFGSIDEAVSNARLNGYIVKGDMVASPANMKQYFELSKHVNDLEAQLGAPTSKYTDLISDIDKKIEKVTALVEKHAAAGNKGLHKTAMNQMDTLSNTRLYAQQKLAAEQQQFAEAQQHIRDQIDVMKERLRNFPKHKEGVTIEPQGSGFYINHVVYLPEKEEFVKNTYLTHKYGEQTLEQYRKSFKSTEASTGIPYFSWGSGWLNNVMGRGRTPAERLSIAENRNRAIATHGPAVLLEMIEQGVKPITNIPREYWKDFNRLITFGQKAANEETGLPGIVFDHPGQIEDWYIQNVRDKHGDIRMPSPQEVEAYFAYKTTILDDLHMRSMAVHKNKLILGTEEHSVASRNDLGRTTGDWFEGVRRQELPFDLHHILIVGDTPKDSKVMRSMNITRNIKNPHSREKLQEDITSGRAKLVEVLDPSSKPLSAYSDKRIHYVISYQMDSKPLEFKLLNRTAASGHLIPEWDWYIKQAKFDHDGDVHVYNGDKTLMSFRTQAEAQEALPHLENVRQLLQKHYQMGKQPGVEEFENEGGALGKNYLELAAEANRKTGIPWHTHHDWYLGDKPMLDINEPIHVVPKNTLLVQTEQGDAMRKRLGGTFYDGTKEASLMSRTMVEFTGERDAQELYTMINKGSKQDPLFSYEPAPYLDPITTMNRAYSRIVKTMYMDDMKEYSVEHWIKQASPFLKDSKAAEDSPLYHFYHPTYAENIHPVVKGQLESNRKAAADFLGVHSDFDKSVYRLSQEMMDAIYKAPGSGQSKWKAMTISALSKTKNPIGFIRGVAYHTTLGLFSIKSFFTQFATMGNILAISPRHAPSGAMATFLYGLTKLNRNPEILSQLDKMATELTLTGRLGITSRFKPGQFTEAMKLMESTGFHKVGNEHAFAANMPNNSVVKIGVDKYIMNPGQVFFRAGAGSTRVAGFFTAYLEHMAENAAVTKEDLPKLLARASLLDHNMSSAFSSKLHTGWMSWAGMFQAYNLRLMEMFTGKQLTRQEKVQLFAGTTLLWGLRGGGLGLLGYPLANYVIQQLEARGEYMTGDHPMVDFLINGLPALIAATITGQGDPSKGTWYNFSKLGNQGIDPLEKMFEEDKSFFDLALGVPGSMTDSLLRSAWPFYAAMRSGEFSPSHDDVIHLFDDVSIIRDSWKTWAAIKTGQWMTRNETKIGDISKFNAVVAGLTGLTPQEFTDVFYKQRYIKNNNEAIEGMIKRYSTEMARMIIDDQNNDRDSAERHLKNARAIMDVFIPSHRQSEAMKKALQTSGRNLIDKINWDLYIKTNADYQMYEKFQKIQGQQP